MAAKLYRVIQPVGNIERAAAFYAGVFELPGERVSPGRHYFHCGSTVLACYDPVTDGDGSGRGWRHHYNQYIYFAVADLEEALRRFREHGGEIEAEIETMPWGERLFYAKDPFGNPISFVDETTVFVGADETGAAADR